MAEKTVRVWEVCIDTDDDYNGNVRTLRSRDERHMRNMAAISTYMGRPATVIASDVPRSLARRWGLV
jgi:hypothetical protein